LSDEIDSLRPAGSPSQLGSTIADGRIRLLLFRIAGGRFVPPAELTPAARLAFGAATPESMGSRISGGLQRCGRGFVIAIVPLGVLALASAFGDPDAAPGWITWIWCAALCAINLIYLVGGPILWNALITAGLAIDEVEMSVVDDDKVAGWVRGHYVKLRTQGFLVALGAGVGMVLLWYINLASGYAFTLGAGEYLTMAWTAGLSVNGLWILWWVADLIPTLGRQSTFQLDWHNPARTPAVVFLNRALWKAGGAISLGMVFLAIAVQGQPSPFSLADDIPNEWVAAVIVEYIAFLIVATVFVRDSIWAQSQIFRLVRSHIDRRRQPIDARLRGLVDIYAEPGGRAGKVLYYAEIDRHFDSLRAVDLKLGWALAWGTSIFGAGVSVLASAISITPG
jgi:hypothetical protein